MVTCAEVYHHHHPASGLQAPHLPLPDGLLAKIPGPLLISVQEDVSSYLQRPASSSVRQGNFRVPSNFCNKMSPAG